MPEQPAGWCRPCPQGCLLKIQAKPNARQSALTGIKDNVLGARLAAKPAEGAANQELIRLLSSVFKLSPAHFDLYKGEASKFKQVIVQGLTPAAAQTLLDAYLKP